MSTTASSAFLHLPNPGQVSQRRERVNILILTGGAHLLGFLGHVVLAGDVAALNLVQVILGELTEAGAGFIQGFRGLEAFINLLEESFSCVHATVDLGRIVGGHLERAAGLNVLHALVESGEFFREVDPLLPAAGARLVTSQG